MLTILGSIVKIMEDLHDPLMHTEILTLIMKKISFSAEHYEESGYELGNRREGQGYHLWPVITLALKPVTGRNPLFRGSS
jgi:hypothetical protein